MIITSRLAWFHLPKTAGTTTDQLFITSGLKLLWHDSQSSPVKHLSALDHPYASSLPLSGKQYLCNFRRLPYWLLSNYQHKIVRMGLEIDHSFIQQGLFWRERQQEWLPADWWLDKFSIDDSWSFLRVEYLKSDFLRCLSLYEPINCLSGLRVRFVPSKNKTLYKRSLIDWFSMDNLRNMYFNNPRWTSLEQDLYGNLMVDM